MACFFPDKPETARHDWSTHFRLGRHRASLKARSRFCSRYGGEEAVSQWGHLLLLNHNAIGKPLRSTLVRSVVSAIVAWGVLLVSVFYHQPYRPDMSLQGTFRISPMIVNDGQLWRRKSTGVVYRVDGRDQDSYLRNVFLTPVEVPEGLRARKTKVWHHLVIRDFTFVGYADGST